MPARIWVWGLVPLSIVALLALGDFREDGLDQAVACDPFKRLPNGTWVTVKDVSLSYKRYFGNYQSNYGKGSIITGTGNSESARLLTALNKVWGETIAAV